MTIKEETTDVLIVGAGPAGLMLATCLARFGGLNIKIIDERFKATSSGRADGLQPKTLETFEQLNLLNKIESNGVKVYDITFWEVDDNGDYIRKSREDHFPKFIDLRRPYILLTHQGIVENVLIDDMSKRNVQVERGITFSKYTVDSNSYSDYPIISEVSKPSNNEKVIIRSKYIIGADGAHSMVRKSMAGVNVMADTTDLRWAVIDGVLESDFPDFWTKTVIRSKTNGTVLAIPRERNLTRLYIELEPDFHYDDSLDNKEIQTIIQHHAEGIIKPFSLSWKSVEWFSIYRVRQGSANHFIDPKSNNRAFILGDASHTHSANAAQGMNVSMHDSLNLAWKLNMVLKLKSKLTDTSKLLTSFEEERQKVAEDLINFDKVHTKAFNDGNTVELVKNFETNIKFISGVGAEYQYSNLNSKSHYGLKSGTLPPPADVKRFIDSNPVHLESDIPMLGQFRIYFGFIEYTPAIEISLKSVCQKLEDSDILKKLRNDNIKRGADFIKVEEDLINDERYTAQSEFITMAIVSGYQSNPNFEIKQLPELLQEYKWSIYLDTENKDVDNSALRKWFNISKDNESDKNKVVVIIIRPDGYVGASEQFGASSINSAVNPYTWITNYFESFLI